jgi:hypothetical protein
MDAVVTRKTMMIEAVMGVAYTDRLRKAFPEADPGILPFGYHLVIQLRTPKLKSDGGILFADETKDTDRYRMQTGLVRSIGPNAFRRRDTGEQWPGGDWCREGDFVRCPMYGGDRWFVKFGDKPDDIALFLVLKDTDLIGLVTGDPLQVITS